MVECMPDIWSRSGYNSTQNKRDVFSTGHIIFNGLKVNDNPKPKRLQALGKFCTTISIYSFFHSKILKHHYKSNLVYFNFFSENSWQAWSKVGILSMALVHAGIIPDSIHFIKLMSPKNHSYFMYCVLIVVDLPLLKDETKCLNVIQENRGKIVPGYLTLFQRVTSLRCHSIMTFFQLFF